MKKGEKMSDEMRRKMSEARRGRTNGRRGKTKYPIDREWLSKKYLDEGLSQNQIASLVGCCQQWVWKMMREYGIKARTRRETSGGKNNGRWKGGRRVDKDGYILAWKPEHPNADYHGYVREHRLVAEKALGRLLKPDEVVHHWGRRDDNHPSNLLICTKEYHDWLHIRRIPDRLGRDFSLSAARFHNSKKRLRDEIQPGV